MPHGFAIRAAEVSDADACAAIYTPYVISTAITFEIDPPTPSQMAARITEASRDYAWLVVEDEGAVAGYAYAHAFAVRAAYRWACETSVYLELGRRRTGAGRALYEELFARLADRGYRRAIAGMTLPNDASVGLHTAVGFEPMGVYRQIGWKNDAWHDVAWMQKTISQAPDPPEEPH